MLSHRREPPTCSAVSCKLVLLTLALLCACDSIEITPVEEVSRDEAPAWSPDGRRVAYWHFNTNLADTTYVTGLYVLDLESGHRRLVIEGFAQNPDWSPDGTQIAFNSGDIFTIRADGSDLRRITTHGSAFFPSWSRDAQKIAYDATTNWPNVPGDSSGIWFMTVSGGKRKHLGLGRNPDWSPDGARIVYEGPPGDATGAEQIWTADTTGAARNQLTVNAFSNRNAAWSPEGEWIAWTVLYGGGTFGIWTMRQDGSDQHEVIGARSDQTVGVSETTPSWSPDGGKLVFGALAPQRDRIVLWVVNRDGTGRRQLTF